MTTHPHPEPSEEASSLPVVAWEHNEKKFIVADPVPRTWSPGEWSPLVRLSDAQSQLNAMRVERDKWYQEAAAQAASAIAAHDELAALKAAPVVDVEAIMALAEAFAKSAAMLDRAIHSADCMCSPQSARRQLDAAREALRAAVEARP